MKYTIFTLSLITLACFARVETMKELMEEAKEYYDLPEDFYNIQPIIENEGIETTSVETQVELDQADDSINEYILFTQIKNTLNNQVNHTQANSTQNYTFPQNSTIQPNSSQTTNQTLNGTSSAYNYTYSSSGRRSGRQQFNNQSNTTNNTNYTNNTNGSYPYNPYNNNTNGTYPYNNNTNGSYPYNNNTNGSYPYNNNTINNNTINNQTNGSSTNYTYFNRRPIQQSKIQLKLRNPRLQALNRNNFVENVTYYNQSNSTYEYIVIYNKTETIQNQTDTFYYFYQNSTVLTLEREIDENGNVVYRSYDLDFDLIVASNSTFHTYQNNKYSFGTLVITNHTLGGQFDSYGNSNWNYYTNNTYGYGTTYDSSYGKVNVGNGTGNAYRNSNQEGNVLNIQYGNGDKNSTNTTSQYQQNGFNYQVRQSNQGYVDRKNNQTSSSSTGSVSWNTNFQNQTQYQYDNVSVTEQTQDSESQYNYRYDSQQNQNGTQDYYHYNQNQNSNSNSQNDNVYYGQYQAQRSNNTNTQGQYTFTNTSNYYGGESNNFDYNYNYNQSNSDLLSNGTNQRQNTNSTSYQTQGSQSRNSYDYGDYNYTYESGNSQTLIDQSTTVQNSDNQTTTTSLNQEQNSVNTTNYQYGDDPFQFYGNNQTTRTQTVTQQENSQFNQLRGSKKQNSTGTWKKLSDEELNDQNLLIIEEAVQAVNWKFNPQQDGYEFDSIVSVHEQIVSGFNYLIKLRFNNSELESQIYEVIIYSAPWTKNPLQIISCQQLEEYQI